MKTLHIIEPTLSNQAGHCHGYVQSLLEANQSNPLFNIEVWHDHKASSQSLFPFKYKARPYFLRSIRKVQLFFCLLFLMLKKDIIFIPTSGRVELIIIHVLSSILRYKTPLFVHFHQIKLSNTKIKTLNKIAKKHKNLQVMTPTEALKQLFIELGFQHVTKVPCPSYLPTPHIESVSFSHILYAGAMRKDKGFPLVVQLVKANDDKNLLFKLQCSPNSSGKVDKECQEALETLETLNKSNMQIHKETLSHEAYLQNFLGAITLMLYDTDEYANKFSGVSLDSICHGAPIITFHGTPISETVLEYGAGIVLRSKALEDIKKAIDEIKKNYAVYQKACIKASITLSQIHHPRRTLEFIMENS